MIWWLIPRIKITFKNFVVSLKFGYNKALLSLLKRVLNKLKIQYLNKNFYQIINMVKNRAIKLF